MIPVLLDCDPGHDDAVALIYAAAHMRPVAVTTVYGNAGLDHTTANALSLCTLLGLDVPVARGADRPLLAPPIAGGELHGASGLDGAVLPVPDRDVVPDHAVDLILRTARAHADRGDPLLLAATGALTNVALALTVEPRLAGWLRGITVMGGSAGIGNTAPVAEFNILCDPEAADIVLRCGCPLWLVGLDVTRRVGVDAADIAALRKGGGTVARVIADLLDYFLASLRRVHGLQTASLHDPCALVPFVAPAMMELRHTHVAVELTGTHTRGMTVCDLRRLSPGIGLGSIHPNRPPNVQLARAPAPGLVAHILDAVRTVDRRRTTTA